VNPLVYGILWALGNLWDNLAPLVLLACVLAALVPLCDYGIAKIINLFKREDKP
jgi:hypothetical protein